MKRSIIITGAGRGIGYATARRFASSGDNLILNDWKFGEDALELEHIAKEAGGEVAYIEGDVSIPGDVAKLVSEAKRRHGHVDVIVSNAGIMQSGPTGETTFEEYNRVIAVNLTGAWNCIHAVLPGMIERRQGRIISVSSELGLIGFASYAAYCASKGGVISLTKAVAKEAAPYGVLVNSVAPGPIETDMLIKDSIEYNDETRMQLPLRRFGKPDEIASAIEFLAGPGGSYMVGQILSPNGGAAI